ncbi:Lipid A export ATP-binding/permease protein MsbA [Dissulfuribacter thermophilus]|uniref:Lipid A export ATP-binding/permease protein MsbA n=1 Tax=Dissulfuribacter thermophilus TaxID=1156395 RepID=A0A1B9F533_9BACT|nr:ABC transporter ATP-binding protein [Dissulfuribacter thermophilus]OCC15032.1 Lipid A export ATP-binding/permease protein MsbA [Dissulfuribacter thermophilus]
MAKEIEKLWSIIRPYSKRVLIAIFFSLIVSGVNGAIAWLVKPAMDYIFVEKRYELLWILPFGILGLYILRGLGSLLQAYYMQTSGFKLIRDMRVRCFETIMDLPFSTVQKWSSGEMISRVMSDIGLLSKILSDSFKTFLVQIPSLIVLMGVAIYRKWDLTLLSFVMLPIIAIVTKHMSQFLKNKRKDVQQATALLTHRMNEAIQGIKVIKIFTLELIKTKQFKTASQVHYHQNARLIRIKEGTKFLTELLSGVAVSIIIGYGGYLVVKGKMTSGDFFSVLTAIVMAFAPLKKLGKSYGTFQESVGVLERIEDFLALKPEDSGDIVAAPLKKGITFKNVTFSYPGTNELVLNGINLFIPKGKTFAIVGPSGAGKSTLVDLIPRFFDPTTGQILWDDLDLKDLDTKSLRRLIGLVTQDIVLFGDTIRENIAYGRSDATDKEIEEAARMAQAHDFIKNLPQGYDTVLDERGLNLSGGQRQRIAIARALLKDPPLLILDEATSALDTLSEQGVQEALKIAKKGRTTITIAHRLSTIQDADLIAVMDNGKIVDIGSHKELISKSSLYRDLYRQWEQ